MCMSACARVHACVCVCAGTRHALHGASHCAPSAPGPWPALALRVDCLLIAKALPALPGPCLDCAPRLPSTASDASAPAASVPRFSLLGLRTPFPQRCYQKPPNPCRLSLAPSVCPCPSLHPHNVLAADSRAAASAAAARHRVAARAGGCSAAAVGRAAPGRGAAQPCSTAGGSGAAGGAGAPCGVGQAQARKERWGTAAGGAGQALY